MALDTLLTKPPHGLRAQGHSPRELPAGMVGSDGYGFAWYADESATPARYRQTLPIWVDANLDTIAPHVRSRCIVASTRTATEAMPVSITNTPPFLSAKSVLVHNGSIGHFHERVLEGMRAQLSAPARAALRGNSDTEYLAALLGEIGGGTLPERVHALLSRVGRLVSEARAEAQLNLIVADGEQLVAVRHAIGQSAPSLYLSGRGAHDVVVASEPMDALADWTRFAPDTVLHARLGGRTEIDRLDLD